MYNEDVTRIPKNTDELWDVLSEQYGFVRHVLCDYPVETREDAVNGTYRRNEDGTVGPASMAMIRYRSIDPQWDQRDYFLEMGRSLLESVADGLDRRELTPRFVQEWGQLMFCHGYIASFIFDDGNDVAEIHAAQKSAEIRSTQSQQTWVGLLIAQARNAGLSRNAAEEAVAELVRSIKNNNRLEKKFANGWFEKIITRNNQLRSAYSQKHLSMKRIRELIANPIAEIPPVPANFPSVRHLGYPTKSS